MNLVGDDFEPLLDQARKPVDAFFWAMNSGKPLSAHSNTMISGPADITCRYKCADYYQKSHDAAAVAEECVTKFEDLKQGKNGLRYVLYKLSEDRKTIVVESSSSSENWDDFRSTFTKFNPRFATYRFTHDDQQKLLFISWMPDTEIRRGDPYDEREFARIKILYTASRYNMKNKLVGIDMEIKAGDQSDLDYEAVLEDVQRKSRR